MILHRIALVFTLLALLTASVSAAKDSDSRGLPGHGMMPGVAFSLTHDILVEATGLEVQDLRAALMEGSTVAELIEANEGDVAAVTADVVAHLTAEINDQLAFSLESLEERVTEALNTSAEPRGFWGRPRYRMPRILGYGGIAEAVMEATGLEAADLRAALMDGSTIAELVEANEGDLESLTAAIAATFTEAMNGAAAARIESLEDHISEAFNTDFAERWRRIRRPLPGPRGFFGFGGFWGMPNSADSATAAG